MTESKIKIVERLRREGRWPEASKFKDTALGVSRQGHEAGRGGQCRMGRDG